MTSRRYSPIRSGTAGTVIGLRLAGGVCFACFSLFVLAGCVPSGADLAEQQLRGIASEIRPQLEYAVHEQNITEPAVLLETLGANYFGLDLRNDGSASFQRYDIAFYELGAVPDGLHVSVILLTTSYPGGIANQAVTVHACLDATATTRSTEITVLPTKCPPWVATDYTGPDSTELILNDL